MLKYWTLWGLSHQKSKSGFNVWYKPVMNYAKIKNTYTSTFFYCIMMHQGLSRLINKSRVSRITGNLYSVKMQPRNHVTRFAIMSDFLTYCVITTVWFVCFCIFWSVFNHFSYNEGLNDPLTLSMAFLQRHIL